MRIMNQVFSGLRFHLVLLVVLAISCPRNGVRIAKQIAFAAICEHPELTWSSLSSLE